MFFIIITVTMFLFFSLTSTQYCDDKDLAQYKLSIHTFWSEELYPKHFPNTRPVAQWSKLYGVSHNENLTLFKVDTFADESLKEYSKYGKTETFENSLNFSNILSQFYIPPIKTGVGNGSTNFFVNANHSKVSFVLKIHPSPDWFVGVDSLQLCQNGTWINNKTIDAEPMDAGVDQGFTFTSPDYENETPEAIFKMNTSYPNEPYGSFYYKNKSELPILAKFTLTKVQEYEIKVIADDLEQKHESFQIHENKSKVFFDDFVQEYDEYASFLVEEGESKAMLEEEGLESKLKKGLDMTKTVLKELNFFLNETDMQNNYSIADAKNDKNSQRSSGKETNENIQKSNKRTKINLNKATEKAHKLNKTIKINSNNATEKIPKLSKELKINSKKVNEKTFTSNKELKINANNATEKIPKLGNELKINSKKVNEKTHTSNKELKINSNNSTEKIPKLSKELKIHSKKVNEKTRTSNKELKINSKEAIEKTHKSNKEINSKTNKDKKKNSKKSQDRGRHAKSKRRMIERKQKSSV